MKRSAFCLIPAALLMLLAACDSGVSVQAVNNTSFPAYVRVEDSAEQMLPAGASHTFKFDTAAENLFNNPVEKEITVWAAGETFQLEDFDEGNLVPTDSVTFTMKAGESRKLPLIANRASFKVVNSSSQFIESVYLYKHNFVAGSIVNHLDDIAPGESRYLRLQYATPNNNFYYYATVLLEDGTSYTFGSETNILDKDQQFLITITDPEE